MEFAEQRREITVVPTADSTSSDSFNSFDSFDNIVRHPGAYYILIRSSSAQLSSLRPHFQRRTPAMAQSLTSVERDNPPPRRKSCFACTKARRRCDQARPACQRCTRRHIDCQYPHDVRHRRDQASSHAPSAAVIGASAQSHLSSDLAVLQAPRRSADPTDFMLDPLGDFLGVMAFSSSSGGVMDPSAWEPSLALIPLTPAGTVQPWLDRSQVVGDPKTSQDFTSRLQYSLEKISASPRQMVLENTMPWCHAHLYDDHMPKSMQDAVSLAAFFEARNSTNARTIRSCIESRVQDLVSSPCPSAPLEILARTHALLVYQILRLQDDDLRVRMSCDATMPLLEQAAYALLPHIVFHDPAGGGQGQPSDGPADLPLYPIAATREFWESWVFQESARRTLAVVLFFLLSYRYLKGDAKPQCTSPGPYPCRSLTLSAHLWRASDPVDFALAWRDREHFVVHGKAGDDIDDFGKILLTTVLGVDQAKGWLAVRGATL
ncbi:hypothetical protein VTK73DRAFT_6768 [Phialemonium thermophilum]|uniref:Zn(2)-C6 fungal-type domain-containing protein n=1 Tax=Phialemonium thermophilum TaxID=223376 RepID=A0ABR3WHS4_9PEZI